MTEEELERIRQRIKDDDGVRYSFDEVLEKFGFTRKDLEDAENEID